MDRTKKLSLSKETLRALDAADARLVGGGAVKKNTLYPVCATGCGCATGYTCGIVCAQQN